MLRRRLAERALAASLLGALAVGTVPALAQTIEKTMYVSVLNQAGMPIPNLTPGDFIVREDNVSREVLRVAPATDPMQVAVLVDNSTASRTQIPYLREAVPTFVNALVSETAGAKNQVAIVGFGERPTILADYTSDTVTLKKAADRIWAAPLSGPYLLDAIFETAQGIVKRESQRPVIVAIATETQELSYREYMQVLQQLAKSGAQLYVLMLGMPYSGTNLEATSRELVIGRGPAESGGRREQVLTGIALSNRLKLLADELTHQYKVTYARPQTLIPPEKVTVAVKTADATVHGALARDSQGKP